MAGYYMYIDGAKKAAFIEELLEHELILECDIEERADRVLVLANVIDDFLSHSIDGRTRGALKVVFDAEHYFDNPIL